MAKNIEPKLKLISAYLKLEKNEFFIIPEYQRAYSWDLSQCDKLFQDIESFIDTNSSDPYFFGTIIVDCSDATSFCLIDGQQRTTTFLLLLKALLIQLNFAIDSISNDEDADALMAGLKANRNKIMSILYKAEDEEIPAMIKDFTKAQNILILENKSINELHSNEVSKIINSKDFDEAEFNAYKIPRKQKDNKYTNHFRNFKFFYNKLKEKGQSNLNEFAKTFLNKCQIIEIRSWQIEQAITMFNSLNSSGLPLSDSDIISAQLYSKAGANTEKFNELWQRINKITDDLSSRNIIDIDSALQQLMYINRAQDKVYINEDSVDVTTPGLRRYYTEINKGILNSPVEFSENLLKIAETWNAIKDYPLVKLLLKSNENAKLYLSSYLYKIDLSEITVKKTTPICECLLKLFTILELIDAGYSSKNFKTFLFKQNIHFVDKTTSIRTIANDFKNHINKNWEKEDIFDFILAYENHFLVYLNEYLFSKENGTKFDFSDHVNIEHIMPSSGRNISTIREDAGIFDKEDFDNIVNKLGNKILLEEDINKSIGNEWFKTKKQNSIKNKSGYKDSKYSIALSLSSHPTNTWTKEDIEAATKKSASRIIDFIFN